MFLFSKTSTDYVTMITSLYVVVLVTTKNTEQRRYSCVINGHHTRHLYLLHYYFKHVYIEFCKIKF